MDQIYEWYIGGKLITGEAVKQYLNNKQNSFACMSERINDVLLDIINHNKMGTSDNLSSSVFENGAENMSFFHRQIRVIKSHIFNDFITLFYIFCTICYHHVFSRVFTLFLTFR